MFTLFHLRQHCCLSSNTRVNQNSYLSSPSWIFLVISVISLTGANTSFLLCFFHSSVGRWANCCTAHANASHTLTFVLHLDASTANANESILFNCFPSSANNANVFSAMEEVTLVILTIKF